MSTEDVDLDRHQVETAIGFSGIRTSVGSRFEDVMAKFGLPQKIGSGKLPGQKILDYQGNCIRITALAQSDESMEDWKFQDVCWGFVNVPEK